MAIPGKIQSFIDANILQDRKTLRSFGANTHQKSFFFATSFLRDTYALPSKEDMLKAISQADSTNYNSELSKRLFATLDRIIKLDPKFDKPYCQSGSYAVDNDVVFYFAKDTKGQIKRVSVLIKDKIFNANQPGEYSIDNYEDKARIFLGLDEDGKEITAIKSHLLGVDDFSSLERLDGERIQAEVPGLNRTVQELVSQYGHHIDQVEFEMPLLSISADDFVKIKDLGMEMPSTDPERFRNLLISSEKLDEMDNSIEITPRIIRIRLNLDTDSNIASINTLNEAVDFDTPLQVDDTYVSIKHTEIKA